MVSLRGEEGSRNGEKSGGWEIGGVSIYRGGSAGGGLVWEIEGEIFGDFERAWSV